MGGQRFSRQLCLQSLQKNPHLGGAPKSITRLGAAILADMHRDSSMQHDECCLVHLVVAQVDGQAGSGHAPEGLAHGFALSLHFPGHDFPDLTTLQEMQVRLKSSDDLTDNGASLPDRIPRCASIMHSKAEN